MNQPSLLANALGRLSFSAQDAAQALIDLAFQPAQVGLQLWNDGYHPADVGNGVFNALPASTRNGGSWASAVMSALHQVTAAATTTPFTPTDAALALQGEIGTQCDSSCVNAIARARGSAGFSASDVANVLFTTYQQPFSQTYFDEPVGGLGYDLEEAGFTPAQVVPAEQALGATTLQIATSLLATTFNDNGSEAALQVITGTLQGALSLMKRAGYGPVRVALALENVLTTIDPTYTPFTVYGALYNIGYGLSDIEVVQAQLFPFNEQAFVNAFSSNVGWTQGGTTNFFSAPE